MAKDKNNTHSNLTANKLPPPIARGKEKDYTYSVRLAKLLRRFVRLAAPFDDPYEHLDVKLLDDVLRYGRLQTAAKKRGCTLSYATQHLSRALALLEQRVLQWESAQARAIEAERAEELERELAETRQRIADIEQQLERVRNNSVDFNRFYAITTARLKSMAAEAYLRERGKT